MAAAVAGLWGLTLVLLLGEPAIGSDQGVFLSVAARVLDGDALYTEVVDNKDPLFFTTYAGALLAGGWRGPSLLDGVWFGLAGLALAATVRALGAPAIAVAVAFLVYPLALAGGWYFTGMSMLGALALAPASVWLWLRGRFLAAGVLVGVTLLLKLNLALVLLAPLVALIAVQADPVTRRRQAVAGAAGLTAFLAAAAVVLAAAGSLRAYLETIAYNVHYANARVDSDSPITRVRTHLAVVTEYFAAGGWQGPIAVGAVVAFAAFGVVVLRRGDRPSRLLVLLAGATFVAGMATIALTAYYAHHLQLLALPAALAAAALVTAAARARMRLAAAVAVACVTVAGWAAVKSEWPPTVSQWAEPPVSVGARELERARERYYASAGEVGYAVFGTNGEDGHAAFIDDSFDLACRWFHLYRVSTAAQFAETLECLERERPELILVTFGFYDEYPGATEWNAFVDEVRRRLAEGYVRVSAAPPGFEVWRRARDA